MENVIVNPTGDVVEVMHNGWQQRFQPGEKKAFSEGVAKFIVEESGKQGLGLVFENDVKEEVKTEEVKESEASNEVEGVKVPKKRGRPKKV